MGIQMNEQSFCSLFLDIKLKKKKQNKKKKKNTYKYVYIFHYFLNFFFESLPLIMYDISKIYITEYFININGLF